jgi:hypothetical protein
MNFACFGVKLPAPLSVLGSFRCFGAVLLCVFLLSGCRVLQDSGFGGDDPQSAEPVSEESVWKGELAEGQEDNPSIKEKFGVTLKGTDGVAAAFHELKAFINKGGLESSPSVISTGDWIDLEDGLTVAAYGSGENMGAFSATNSALTNAVAHGALPYDYEGSTLRLIVVGINSFKSKAPYMAPVGNEVGHVVFQFQNLPVKRRMNPDGIGNVGGYAASEMRKYLVPVDDDEESGKFLAGLITAGVPEGVLWAPTRYVANGGDKATKADEINDILWLPTEREMFGYRVYSSQTTHETAANQARLEYYNDDLRRIKCFETSNVYFYWGASPYFGDSTYFCDVHSNGYPYGNKASIARGVAPAFCVR